MTIIRAATERTGMATLSVGEIQSALRALTFLNDALTASAGILGLSAS
jgi:hypothetical protein